MVNSIKVKITLHTYNEVGRRAKNKTERKKGRNTEKTTKSK
jgi:hypothetical protein